MNMFKCRRATGQTDFAIAFGIFALVLSLVAVALSAWILFAPHAQADRCYQKLLYQICVGDDGQWRTEPVPALPIPGLPPPAPDPATP
jgi:hypothetical protein